MKYKNIPIAAAKRIAKEYDKDQVIIMTWDKVHGLMHITTYGKTIADCEQAAMGGNLIKKTLGFPEEACGSMPRRSRKKHLANSGV